MLYFAYGSNLDPEQMQFRCPGAKAVGLAGLRAGVPLDTGAADG